MKKLIIAGKSFMDFYVMPLIVCFTVIIGIVSLKFKESFPITVKITAGVAFLAIVIVLCYWLQKFIKFPIPKFFHFLTRVILTPVYGLLVLPIYWGIAAVGLAIFTKWENLFYKVGYYVSLIVAFASGALAYKEGDFSKISDGKPKIVIMNHASFIDYILAMIAMAFHQKWKVVIGVNLRKYWPFNKYIKRLGIFIERGNDGSDTVVARKILEAIDQGYNVVVFAGGGRDRPGEIKSFEIGPFAIALKKNIEIILIALHDTGKYCPAGPKSKNTTGQVPKGFFKLLWYRIRSGLDVVILFLEGKADHMLISPRPIKLQILPPLSLVNEDGHKKTAQALAEEAHTKLHKVLGNII